jgi:predicted nucleotidyltransferase
MRMLDHGERLDDPDLHSILVRVLELYRPERVYLFGSRARGDHRDDSDFDLLAVLPDDADEERLRSRRFYENCWDLPRSADVLIWRRTSFDAQAARVVASLPATVVREGKLLYAA